MAQIVLASHNKGKVVELKQMLSEFGIEVHSLTEYPEIGEIVEDGETFEENCLIKARAVCKATGKIAVADDSGLEVDALGGRPGVYTARYAGEHATDEENYTKLLGELGDLPDEKRGAQFVCVVAAVAPNGETITARGQWRGRIGYKPIGDNGFGYDPVFTDPELGRTNAQLTREEKNARSHRGNALRLLLEQWPDFWKKVGE